MKLQNFETGLQRVYYLIWAMIVSFVISMMICGGDGWLRGYGCGRHRLMEFQAIVAFAIAVVLPGIVMFAGRWIYRGFVPKQLP